VQLGVVIIKIAVLGHLLSALYASDSIAVIQVQGDECESSIEIVMGAIGDHICRLKKKIAFGTHSSRR
jgi:hypothetical protein